MHIFCHIITSFLNQHSSLTVCILNFIIDHLPHNYIVSYFIIKIKNACTKFLIAWILKLRGLSQIEIDHS